MASAEKSVEKERIDKRLKSIGCNIEQTSILTTRQRQAAVELFRGIDVDKNALLSQEEIEEACGNLLGLSNGMREAADTVMATIDQSKYKTRAPNKDALVTKAVDTPLVQPGGDGRIDLPEWLQYLRKIKQEKVADMLQHPMFTPEQAIVTANTGLDRWLKNMMLDLKSWRQYRVDKQREEAKLKREQELINKTETLLDSPTSQTKNDLYNLSAAAGKHGIHMFNRIDLDHSGSFDIEEIVCFFTDPEKAAEMTLQLDSDEDGAIGLDEWLVFLRRHKREAVTLALSEHPEDFRNADKRGQEAVDELFRELEEGLESHEVSKQRREIRRREQDMRDNTRRIMESKVLGGMKVCDPPKVQKQKALILKNKSNRLTLEYTPDRKLIYDPTAANPYSARENCPLSVSEWGKNVRKSAAQAASKDVASSMAVANAESTRENASKASHAKYQSSTGSLNVRVADTKHAEQAIYKSLAVAEGAIQEVNEATEAVTRIFESEADALDQILHCKRARFQRPESERIKDEASLSLKNREEELDPATHEVMLAKLDKLRRLLLRLQKKLNFELGTKLVAYEVDREALAMEPVNDPPEEPSPAAKEVINDKDMVTLPSDKLRLFETFARKQVLRGTRLPSSPQFSQIEKCGMLMDKTEFKIFCKKYSLESILGSTRLMTVFHQNSFENKGYLTADEFAQCAYEVEKVCNDMQRSWAVQKPKVVKARAHQSSSLWGTAPLRDASLTIKQLEHQTLPSPRPQAIYETQALPLSEPVSWKRNIRDLIDQTEWHAKEATRLLTKANKFVVTHQEADVQGRNEIIAALSRKVNRTEDQIKMLTESIEQAQQDIKNDANELVMVEQRQEAVKDFLQIAHGRLEKRVERPMEEQARDPAHFALNEEVRQGKAELHKLITDHTHLVTSIQNLSQLAEKLEGEVNDKQAAVDLDSDCVTRLSIHLVKAD